MKARFPFGGRIGLIEIFGTIMGRGQAAEYVRLFNRLKDSRRIKAVVIEIDSPGGLVTASNHLYMALSRLSSKKPTVAFISGYGASGAYMISCAATKTIALPGAIVGSIGVISTRPMLQELLQRIGVGVDITKSGELKDMGAFYRDATKEEKQKEQQLIDDLHHRFVEIVAKERHLEEETVQKLATGEVFLAETAKELGLVDETGDLETALDLASKLGNVPKRVTHIRPSQTFLQKLLLRSASSVTKELLNEAAWLFSEQAYYVGPLGTRMKR